MITSRYIASLKVSKTQQGTDSEMLVNLQKDTFAYFVDGGCCLRNGMIADKTEPGSPASIAVMGLGLSSYPVGVERN